MLAAAAAAIANLETNIDRVAIDEHGSDAVVLIFELRVRDREHLARIIRVIRRMPDVVRVARSLAAHARDAARDEREETDENDDQEDTDK
jgi:guanosine-3',5'-bis(diphosphate) 3'-pyrophosphohydrolase